MDTITLHPSGPHANIAVHLRGNTKDPKKALLLFHGRGALAENILKLTDTMSLEHAVVLAPQAAGSEWYPGRFTISRSENEPYLSSSLNVVDVLLEYCKEEYKLKVSDVVLAGFSQGACLTADYIARNPHEYKGACILSGGLIGSDEDIANTKWHGDMKAMPVYIGCDENDAHIPRGRVESTASVLEQMRADVTLRIYSGLGHAVHSDGKKFLAELMR